MNNVIDLFGEEEDDATASHPAGKGVSPELRALLDAQKWSNRVEIARSAYGQSLMRCKALNLSNVEIARAVGKSEAAVRMYVKRKKELE